MPLYHFHLADGRFDPDEDGTELPDPRHAKIAAVKFAGEYIVSNPEALIADDVLSVHVTTDDDLLLCQVTVMINDAPAMMKLGS